MKKKNTLKKLNPLTLPTLVSLVAGGLVVGGMMGCSNVNSSFSRLANSTSLKLPDSTTSIDNPGTGLPGTSSDPSSPSGTPTSGVPSSGTSDPDGTDSDSNPTPSPSSSPSSNPSSTPTPTSTSIVCNPFGGDGDPQIWGKMKYLPQSQIDLSKNSSTYGNIKTGNYIGNFGDLWTNSDLFPTDFYFSQLNVPDQFFSSGFTYTHPMGGSSGLLTYPNSSSAIVSYFGFEFESDLRLPSGAAPTQYQFAILADDGAILYLNQSTNSQTGTVSAPLINGDGVHPMKLYCANTPTTLYSTKEVHLTFDWFQGPPYYLGFILLYRPWTPDLNRNDKYCSNITNSYSGVGSDGYFFQSNSPYSPLAPYLNLTGSTSNRNSDGHGNAGLGWQVVPSHLFHLPANAPIPAGCKNSSK